MFTFHTYSDLVQAKTCIGVNTEGEEGLLFLCIAHYNSTQRFSLADALGCGPCLLAAAPVFRHT